MISLLAFIFVGLLAVTIAKAIMPGRDPGLGITILLGAIAQILVWFVLHSNGWDRYGQPWSFFLSIGAAAVLLHVYRDMGLEEILADRAARATADPTPPPGPAAQARQSLWARVEAAPAWAGIGAMLLGFTGFVIGFYGPMRFQAWSNQGPMMGIFVTGPGGVLLGALIGGALRITRPSWPARRRLWVLNAVNAAWGLFVLDLVADSRWWH